jgi:hypothetical protein
VRFDAFAGPAGRVLRGDRYRHEVGGWRLIGGALDFACNNVWNKSLQENKTKEKLKDSKEVVPSERRVRNLKPSFSVKFSSRRKYLLLSSDEIFIIVSAGGSEKYYSCFPLCPWWAVTWGGRFRTTLRKSHSKIILAVIHFH